MKPETETACYYIYTLKSERQDGISLQNLVQKEALDSISLC